MSPNSLIRAEIAQETLTILSLGNYRTKSGEIIDIRDCLRYAVNNTKLYVPKHNEQLFSQRDSLINNMEPFETIFEVTNETTLHCCKRLIDERNSNICALNFASAKNPGGGFINGSQAQEESLARASGLYASIVTQKGYYQANKMDKQFYYTDNILYSPNVPVFRNDDEGLLDEPYFVSFITSPAVNIGALKQHQDLDYKKVEEVMINRMEQILAVALINGHKTLVLGAWGCGVFQNDSKDVARYFANNLLGNGLFKNKFEKISFAVLDKSTNKENLSAFQRYFDVKQ